MNKFLHYINDILISLDIPVLINVEDKPTPKDFKKRSTKNKISQKK